MHLWMDTIVRRETHRTRWTLLFGKNLVDGDGLIIFIAQPTLTKIPGKPQNPDLTFTDYNTLDRTLLRSIFTPLGKELIQWKP